MQLSTELMRSFCAAVIVRACQDVERWERIHAGQYLPEPRARREATRNARRAIQWIRGSTSRETLTFQECCEVMDADPDVAAVKIMQRFNRLAVDALEVALPVDRPAVKGTNTAGTPGVTPLARLNPPSQPPADAGTKRTCKREAKSKFVYHDGTGGTWPLML